MPHTPPTTGPGWATASTAVVQTPTPLQRVAGFIAGQVLAADFLNGIFNNFGAWISYLNGPRAAYTSLEGADTAMRKGDTATIYEDDSSTVPGDLLASYRTDGPYAAVATTSNVILLADAGGGVSVYDRANPGGTAIRTMLPTSPSSPVTALTVYGDYAAVAAGNYVIMFRVSTGARLWEYNHGAQVNDVQISGGYTVLAGASGTGGVAGRVLVTSTGAQLQSVVRAVPYYACAIYGRQIAFAGAFLGTNLNIYSITGSLTLTASASVAAGADINAMRTDGRALYLAEILNGHAYCVSWADAATLVDVDLGLGFTPTTISLAVDQGGAYVAAADGTDGALLRMDLRSLSSVWRATVVNGDTVALATDGARVWTLNTTGGATRAVVTYARGNCPGLWTKIDDAVTTYNRFGWLLLPGVE